MVFGWLEGWFSSTVEEEEDLGPDPSIELMKEEIRELLASYPSEAFPFENIAFEGGGVKGLAHAGGLRVLEEAGIAGRIKRVVGTSAGAMTASLFAVGYDSADLVEFFKEDLNAIMNDHRFGKASFLPNIIASYGWNSGNNFTDWFGAKLKERTGKADITFQEVYDKYDCELCLVITNINAMMSEYCHPKTTPDMTILSAVRMSMSFPILFSPVTSDRGCLIVDGGLLCNYPIHCFDGWWLSMKPEDQFLKKLQPLSDRYKKALGDKERFGTYNNKTIGFLLYMNDDIDFFRRAFDERMHKYSTEMKLPDTKLARKYDDADKTRESLSTKHADLDAATDKFLLALKAEKLDTKEQITMEDLQHVISQELVSDDDLKVLFGEDISADAIFAKLKRNNQDWFGYRRIVAYLKEQGFNILSGYMAYHRTEKIDGVGQYLSKLFNTVYKLAQSHVTPRDVERTVGINVGHIGTTDYTLERDDKKFILEQGRRSAVAFLRYYAERNLQEYKRDPAEDVEPGVQSEVMVQQNSIAKQDAYEVNDCQFRSEE